MEQLPEVGPAELAEFNLRVRLRQEVGEDYDSLDWRIRSKCNAAAALRKKCTELEAEAKAASCYASCICTEPEEVVTTAAKNVAEKYSKLAPNASGTTVAERLGALSAEEYKNGLPFRTLRLETEFVNMMPMLRDYARRKILSDGWADVLKSFPNGEKEIWFGNVVNLSRHRSGSSYSFGFGIRRFEAAVAVVLGNADPITATSVLEDSMLPASLAGGCVISLAGKRKENTFTDLRLWRDRAEVVFESLDDRERIVRELGQAAEEQKVIDAKAHEKWLQEHKSDAMYGTGFSRRRRRYGYP